jgi:hypothetical protein
VGGPGTAEPASPARSGGRWAVWIGALAAGALFLAVLLGGHATLLGRDPLGGFYDLQAHSFADLRWDVPARPLGIEAFLIDGKAYTYYGPWPAVLRLPVALVTHSLDGRLTQLSMLLAFAVALLFTARLTHRIRVLVSPGDAATRAERWCVAAFVFLVGAGSVLLFLASRAFVYHEAELWGAALAIGAFEFVVAYATAPNRRDLVLASGLASLAFLTRGSVGAGPVAALGLLFAAGLWAPTRRWVGLPDDERGPARWVPLGVAVVVPLALYAAVNYAKFGSLFSLPLDEQYFSQINAARRAALDANGGSLFGLKFAPTTIVQFLRPDALRLDSLFPWIAFPPRAHVFGGATFDTLDISSSIPSSMPALTVLAIVGLIGVVRPPRTDGPTLRVLRAPVLGAVAGSLVTVTIAFVAHRYLSDFVPLLVLLAAAGVHLVLRWARTRVHEGRTTAVRWATAALGALLVVSVGINLGLSVLYQRKLNPGVAESELADFLRFQYDLHRDVPGGAPPHVVRGGARLPTDIPESGTLYVVGDCHGLYFSVGYAWRALERTPATGSRRLRVRFPDAATPVWQPLVTSGTAGSATWVAANVGPDGRVRLGYRAQGIDDEWHESPPQDPGADRSATVRVVTDTRTGSVEVAFDGRTVLGLSTPVRPSDDATVGRNDLGGPVASTFSGEITELPAAPTLCRDLLRR